MEKTDTTPSPLPAKPTPREPHPLDFVIDWKELAQDLRRELAQAQKERDTARAQLSAAELKIDDLEDLLAKSEAREDKAHKERDLARAYHAACLKELEAIDAALGTNEGHSAVEHIASLTATNAGLVRDKERLDWLEQFFSATPLHVAPEDTEYGLMLNERLLARLRVRAIRQADASLRSAIDAAAQAALTPPTSPATQPPCT